MRHLRHTFWVRAIAIAVIVSLLTVGHMRVSTAAIPVAAVAVWTAVRQAAISGGRWFLVDVMPHFTPVANTAVRYGYLSSQDLLVARLIEVESEALVTAFVIDSLLVVDKGEGVEKGEGVSGGNAKKASIVAHLNTNAVRMNPDPGKWEEAKPGEIDPTPKSVQPVSNNTTEGSGKNFSTWGSNQVYGLIYKAGSTTSYNSVYGRKLTDLGRVENGELISSDSENNDAPYSNEEITNSSYHADHQVNGVYSWYSPDMRKRYDWYVPTYELYNASGGSSILSILNNSSELKAFSSFFNCGASQCGSITETFNQDKAVVTSNTALADTVMDRAFAAGYKIVKVETKAARFAVTVQTTTNYYTGLVSDIHFQREVELCPEGYRYDVKSNGCVITEELMKPATTPCEIFYHKGQWRSDPKNPVCNNFKDRYAMSGNALRLKADKQEVEVFRNPDGSYEIRVHDESGDGAEWAVIKTDSPDSDSNGSAKVDSAETIPNGNFQVEVEIPGSNGSGGLVDVNDSGFAGKDKDAKDGLDGLSDGLDKGVGDLDKALGDGDEGTGHDWKKELEDWLPNLWPKELECQDIVVDMDFEGTYTKFLRGTTTISFCERAQSVREFMGWLIYIITVLYIWRRFMSTEDGKGG